MSAAKAMAMSLDIPLDCRGDTLDIEAQPYLGLGIPVCALIGAGRRRLYIGDFREGAQPAYRCYRAWRVGVCGSAPDALFCGEAAAHRPLELIRESFGSSDTKIADAPPPTRQGRNVLASLGYRDAARRARQPTH